ncbi:uncharacterized protein LOC113211018 [Frankliniella occidentalis]|uniref:Uncharacterized protein LOC113211018 n=1 Tax=Frankliniella occidentalis TaxID=133901 RepID=A0A6J1SVY3_FRAOC|nr:uncharacterized protein LOC113211018 [Frankliniella occidentalis]
MEQLSEAMLARVLRHLDVRDLLACRLVSKRLGAAALHPDAWSHRELVGDRPCVCAVLLLAPCLAKLVYHNHRVFHRRAFLRTRCAVAELALVLHQPDGHHTVEAAVVLRKQESLGRLRRLELCNFFRSTGNEVLVRTVRAATAALDALVVMGGVPSAAGNVQYELPEPGLRRFTFTRGASLVDHCTEPFVNAVLASHGATLEEVHLGPGPLSPASDTMAALLAGAPRLRALTCEMLPGLQAVSAACPALSELVLHAYPSAPYKDALRFLRGCKRLRKVSLKYTYFDLGDSDDSDGGDDIFPDYGTDMVEALAPSSAIIELLSVSGLYLPCPVLELLPPMPALRQLEVLEEPLNDELLLDVTPARAPALRSLRLSTDWKQCGHAWLHKDALRTALAANPSLHVQLKGPIDCPFAECEPCAVLGCHREVGWYAVDQLGVFSHPPGECPAPEHHPVDVPWPWLHIPCNAE